MKSVNLLLKLILDYFLAVILIIIFFIPIMLISLLIYFIDGGSIFFIQSRAGFNGKLINVYKFKTINNFNRKKTVSKFGKFLRITRLDEIPQILNILKGDLSFVGPRPLYKKYVRLYNSSQKKRLTMKPGITGWAQINGDNNISWKKKFELDLWYINNFNIFVDIKIIVNTVFFFTKNIIFYNKVKYKKKVIDKEFNGKN